MNYTGLLRRSGHAGARRADGVESRADDRRRRDVGVRARRVHDARLRGTDSGRCFAEAFSLIRIALIPEGFRQRLIDREIGIGVLIRDSGLESYREVLDVGLDRTADGAAAVFRTYRIFIDHRPVILITEYFPLSLYREGPPSAESPPIVETR